VLPMNESVKYGLLFFHAREQPLRRLILFIGRVRRSHHDHFRGSTRRAGSVHIKLNDQLLKRKIRGHRNHHGMTENYILLIDLSH